MFGSEFGKVVAHLACPRCESLALRRAKRRAGTSLAECFVVCNKCHFVQWDGIKTLDAMTDEDKLKRLNKLLKKAEGYNKKRLERSIATLKERKKFHDLGL